MSWFKPTVYIGLCAAALLLAVAACSPLATLNALAASEQHARVNDVAYGPLTHIALADDMAYELSDLDMLPSIRVRCLNGQVEKPFEFFAPGPN